MKAPSVEPLTLTRNLEAKRVLWEGLFVVVIGALFAFAANEVSPRGLVLTQNYFPGASLSASPPAISAKVAQGVDINQGAKSSPEQILADQLQAKGLQLVNSDQAVQLFHDPRYEQELIVFIDARNDQHYQEGHIPGAFQFDHYHAENHLATVLPACQSAERIVVYCTGGDCEDSKFAALTLRAAGVPNETLSVYGGGMTEWVASGMPVEVGARKSGKFRNSKL